MCVCVSVLCVCVRVCVCVVRVCACVCLCLCCVCVSVHVRAQVHTRYARPQPPVAICFFAFSFPRALARTSMWPSCRQSMPREWLTHGSSPSCLEASADARYCSFTPPAFPSRAYIWAFTTYLLVFHPSSLWLLGRSVDVSLRLFLKSPPSTSSPPFPFGACATGLCVRCILPPGGGGV